MVMAWHDARGPFRWLVGGPTYRMSPWARTVRYDLNNMAAGVDGRGLFLARQQHARAAETCRAPGTVRLVLASRSDNSTTIAAARLLYGPLLRFASRYEYQPCRLHT